MPTGKSGSKAKVFACFAEILIISSTIYGSIDFNFVKKIFQSL